MLLGLAPARVLLIFKSLINMKVKVDSWLCVFGKHPDERRGKCTEIYFSAARGFVLKLGRV